MSRRFRTWFSAPLILLALTVVCRAQEPGGVAGFVLDEEARPLVGAEVSAFPDDRPSIGILPHSFSGASGDFLIRGVPPGRYRITGEKPEDGFGNPIQVLFDSASAQAPTVDVTAGQTTGGVSVRLGPRGGWIAGVVLDAATGKEVGGAAVGVVFPNSDQSYRSRTVGRGGVFRVLLPSDKKVRVRFSAHGYDTWYYGPDGTEARATLIKSSPGETRELTVRLRRSLSETH